RATGHGGDPVLPLPARPAAVRRHAAPLAGVVALATGLACLSPQPTPTAEPPTMTADERADAALLDELLAVDDKDRPAWLARRGVRVIRQLGADACPAAFPVAATAYGIYYLPSDELYAGMTGLWVELCFTTEQDAIA